MLIGYMRPYHDDWECGIQRTALKQLPCDSIFEEEHSKAKGRSVLYELLAGITPGDKIVIYKLFAIADSTRHLVELLEIIHEKKAFLLSISERIDTSQAEGYPFHQIVKHLVEFQSDVISEKTKRGLYEAKQKGNTPGRPRKPDENVKRAILMYQSKRYTMTQITEETGISKSTLYRYLESEGTL